MSIWIVNIVIAVGFANIVYPANPAFIVIFVNVVTLVHYSEPRRIEVGMTYSF